MYQLTFSQQHKIGNIANFVFRRGVPARGWTCPMGGWCTCPRWGGGLPEGGWWTCQGVYLPKGVYLLKGCVPAWGVPAQVLPPVNRMTMTAGADPGYDQGGPRSRTMKFANVVKQSRVSEASPIAAGESGACSRAPEALGFLVFKYAFSHFLDTLF